MLRAERLYLLAYPGLTRLGYIMPPPKRGLDRGKGESSCQPPVARTDLISKPCLAGNNGGSLFLAFQNAEVRYDL